MKPCRSIDRVVTVPPPGPGFAGPQHKAAAVIPPGDFARTNPFFLLMDDRIAAAGPIGEEHPHAGIETVTLVLSGGLRDREGRLDEGDLEWMTAGSGIIHSEDTVGSDDLRVLQLWLVLPEAGRSMAPRVQRRAKELFPLWLEPGVEVRLYSGHAGGIAAPTANVVPVMLADIRLEAGAFLEHDLPASYNGFLLVLEGEVLAGTPSTALTAGQAGWLDYPTGSGPGAVAIAAGARPARVLLYAGEPQRVAIAARGPFVAGSQRELQQRFAAYRAGQFPRASDLVGLVG